MTEGQAPGGLPEPPEELEPEPPDAPDFLERNSRPYHGLMLVERGVTVTLMVALFVVVLLQVVTRYVFDSPLAWTEEIARYLLVWVTFVAAGYVTARRLHITVDLLVAKLSHRWAVAVDTLAGAIVFAASTLMALAAWTGVQHTAHLRSPASGLPMSVIYMAGVVGFAMIAGHSLLSMYVNVRHPNEVPGAMENVEGGV